MCATYLQLEETLEYVAFFDSDEFLVINQDTMMRNIMTRSHIVNGDNNISDANDDNHHDIAKIEHNSSSVQQGYGWIEGTNLEEKPSNILKIFLQHYLRRGSLMLNRYIFGLQSIGEEYSPIPLLKRCVYRKSMVDGEIKTIARVQDIDITKHDWFHPHFVGLKGGTYPVDTDGVRSTGNMYENLRRPDDVAIIHHYYNRSRKEFIQKKLRGR
jgi:hypothetical protein